MNFIRTFFKEFDLHRAILISIIIHALTLVNYQWNSNKKIPEPQEMIVTFQKLENRVNEVKNAPSPKIKPIEKIIPIIKKDAETSIPIKKQEEIKPEVNNNPVPVKSNADVRNEGEIALTDFSNILARHIAKFKQYPKIAQMRGWQGEIVLEVQLNGEGSLISSKIKKGSGFEVLDNEGLEMIKRASPFPIPPEILKGKSFSILVPIRFKLE